MLRVTVSVPVKPTEDVERVREAILNLFPDAEVETAADRLTAVARDLGRLKELVRNGQIPDSARGVMLQGLAPDGSSARFLLGKQAAAAGRAHFGPVRGPLGELEVSLFGDEPLEVERAIYRVAPDTTVPPELAEVPVGERPSPS